MSPHRLMTLFILFLASSLQLAFAQQTAATPATNTATETWSITFDLEESFRGDQLPRVIHLQIDSSGKYLVNYHLVSDDPKIAKTHTNEGQIEETLAAHLNDWLVILKESKLNSSEQELNLGFGATITPGWRGSLSINQANQQTTIKFNSLRAEGSERPKTYNQLVTFLFDLKRFTLGKFDLNIKRAENPDDATAAPR